MNKRIKEIRQKYQAWIPQLEDPTLNSKQIFQILKENYIPFSEDYSIDKIAEQPELGIKRFNGGIYFGGLERGKRSGMGLMLYQNGRISEGMWKEDQKDGVSNELFANGNHYEGHYLNGKPHGNGVYRWSNGEIYDGQWFEGKRDGSGVWQGTRGDSYMGEWKNGQADGYGIHTWVNGDRYEGEFKTNLKCGQGREMFANGDYYIGVYENGKPQGVGEYHWKNGSIYKGRFEAGVRSGYGIMQKFMGKSSIVSEQYRGFYEMDKKHGIGIYEWLNGNCYSGQFENDLRNGYGIMRWSDGSVYQGEWVNGVQQGKGILKIIGQEPQYAYFVDNEPQEMIVDQGDLDDLKDNLQWIQTKLEEIPPEASIFMKAKSQRPKLPQTQQIINNQSLTHNTSFNQELNPNKTFDTLRIKLTQISRAKPQPVKRLNKSQGLRTKEKITEMLNVYSMTRESSKMKTQESSDENVGYLGLVRRMQATQQRVDPSQVENLMGQLNQHKLHRTEHFMKRKFWIPSGSIKRYLN